MQETVVYVTRQADPKATGYFSIKARNETEHQLIGDLKRLARQDDLDLADLVFEGLQYLFKAHKWPPDNPQTQLTNYQQTTLSKDAELKCRKCGCPTVVWMTYLSTKEDHRYCSVCFSKIPLRFDPKIWKITIDHRKLQ
jgi:hypothetical protein